MSPREDHRLFLCESPFLGAVVTELLMAHEQHAPVLTLYQAWVALVKEIEVLWEEVRSNPAAQDPAVVRAELLQIAALAWRAARDLGLDR